MGNDYSQQKNNWVKFNDKNIKKVKLRAYILDISKKISKVNQKTVFENRDTLIDYYNEDGLDGIRRCGQILLSENNK